MSAKRHFFVVAGLLCLSAAVQLLTVRRATITGLDAVRFVGAAREIGEQGFWKTIRREREQPLFSVLVWMVHQGLAQTSVVSRSAWAISAQLTAAAALVLAVVPVYLLSVCLVGPTAAWIGSVFFCVVPEVARLGADGISDSTHLLFLAWALWATVVYLTEPGGRREKILLEGGDLSRQERSGASAGYHPNARNHPLWLLPAGVATALAVLTRVEALILPAALLVTLVRLQVPAAGRPRWPRVAAAAGLFAVGFGLVFLPYLAAAGSLAPGLAIDRMLGRFQPPEPSEAMPSNGPSSRGLASTPATWQLADGEPMSFAHKEPSITLRRRGLAAAAVCLMEESAAAFGYWIGVLALWGFWRVCATTRRRPIDFFARAFFVIFSLAAFRFAASEGYLSARHLVPLVVVGIGCAGYGAVEVGREMWIRCCRWSTTKRSRGTTSVRLVPRREQRQDAHAARLSPVSWAIVVLATLSCLAYGYQPVHASRLGHRQAAQWLVEKASAPGTILDTRGWTGLYSGRATCGWEDAQRAFQSDRLAYVILEDRELHYQSSRSRTLRLLLDVAAQPVAAFAGREAGSRGARTVRIFRWFPDRFARWLKSRPAALVSKEP